MGLARAQMLVPEASDHWFLDHFRSAASRARGDYLGCLDRWWSVVPRDQLLVLFQDDIASRPSAVLDTLVLTDRCMRDAGFERPRIAVAALNPHAAWRGPVPEGPVAVFDFDNYYMGTVVAEDLAAKGLQVTYITTAGGAAAWSFLTNEQPLVHQALAKKGIGYRTLEIVTGFDGATVTLAQIFSGEVRESAARSVVIVGKRDGGSALHAALAGADLAAAGIRSLHLTGDANAPGAVAHAVWQGHRTGEELGRPPVKVRRDAPFALRDLGVEA
jgi:hypothetical protein